MIGTVTGLPLIALLSVYSVVEMSVVDIEGENLSTTAELLVLVVDRAGRRGV
jgi:hypothetical protein